jgi:hypothetical protein
MIERTNQQGTNVPINLNDRSSSVPVSIRCDPSLHPIEFSKKRGPNGKISHSGTGDELTRAFPASFVREAGGPPLSRIEQQPKTRRGIRKGPKKKKENHTKTQQQKHVLPGEELTDKENKNIL